MTVLSSIPIASKRMCFTQRSTRQANFQEYIEFNLKTCTYARFPGHFSRYPSIHTIRLSQETTTTTKKKLKVIHSRHSFIKDTKQTKCNRTFMFSITIRRPKIPTNNSHFRRSVFFLYNVPQYNILWLYHDVCIYSVCINTKWTFIVTYDAHDIT